MVGRGHAVWHPFVNGVKEGAFVCLDEGVGDGHLSLQGGVCCLENIHFNDIFIGNQLLKTTMIGVRLPGGFAGVSGLIVREGDAKAASLMCLEGVHLTRHAMGHLLAGDGGRIY